MPGLLYCVLLQVADITDYEGPWSQVRCIGCYGGWACAWFPQTAVLYGDSPWTFIVSVLEVTAGHGTF